MKNDNVRLFWHTGRSQSRRSIVTEVGTGQPIP